MSTWDRLPWVSIGIPLCGGNSFQGRGNGNVVSCVKQKTLLFGYLTLSLGSIHDPGGRDMLHSFPNLYEFPPQQQMKLQRLPSIYSGSSLSKPNFSESGNERLLKALGLILFFTSVLAASCLWSFFTVSNLHWMISTNANTYGYQLRMQAGNTMRGGSRCEVSGGTHGDILSFEPSVAM